MRRSAPLVVVGGMALVLGAFGGRVDAQVHMPAPEAPPAVTSERERTPAPRHGRLHRIVRGLQRQSDGTMGSGLRVDLDLFVVGQAPTPVLFEDGEIAIGAPVYGGATHDEMLTVVTPPQLRSTAAYRRFRPSVSLDR